MRCATASWTTALARISHRGGPLPQIRQVEAATCRSAVMRPPSLREISAAAICSRSAIISRAEVRSPSVRSAERSALSAVIRLPAPSSMRIGPAMLSRSALAS